MKRKEGNASLDRALGEVVGGAGARIRCTGRRLHLLQQLLRRLAHRLKLHRHHGSRASTRPAGVRAGPYMMGALKVVLKQHAHARRGRDGITRALAGCRRRPA